MDEYKKKVDSIRAPEALIAATLNRIHEEEAKRTCDAAQQPVVVKPFKPRRKWAGFAVVAAAAAALALVVGLNFGAAPRIDLVYGTVPDTIVRSAFPTSDAQSMDPDDYCAYLGMDIESLIPDTALIKSEIQVVMAEDTIISDECTVNYNAGGKPLMLRLSGTQDIIPGDLTQVTPSNTGDVEIYAAVSQSGKSRMAAFRQDGISFFLMGTNMEQTQFEALLSDLLKNIGK